jgi:hypothetical protein
MSFVRVETSGVPTTGLPRPARIGFATRINQFFCRSDCEAWVRFDGRLHSANRLGQKLGTEEFCLRREWGEARAPAGRRIATTKSWQSSRLQQILVRLMSRGIP